MKFQQTKLPILRIAPGQCWRIVSRNRSGKSTLATLLAENFPGTALVSFELEDQLLKREIREDDTDFLDRIDPGRTVRELIEET